MKYKQPKIPRNVLVAVVGKPLTECYQILLGTDDVSSYCLAHHDFQMANLHLSRPFANAIKTLKMLKQQKCKIAAITSRKKNSALETMKQAGVLPYIDYAVFADEVDNHKPHPEPLLKSLHALGSKPEKAVMVGDSDADILAGKNAGTKTAAALYGFHGEKLKSYNPDYVIEDIIELLDLL